MIEVRFVFSSYFTTRYEFFWTKSGHNFEKIQVTSAFPNKIPIENFYYMAIGNEGIFLKVFQLFWLGFRSEEQTASEFFKNFFKGIPV